MFFYKRSVRIKILKDATLGKFLQTPPRISFVIHIFSEKQTFNKNVCLTDTSSVNISRLIKEAVKEQIIKTVDESTSNRYILVWA